jgi:hypothetical protein
MAKRKASESATENHQATAPEATASEAANTPLPIETPRIDTSAGAGSIEMPRSEPLAAILKIESFKAQIRESEAAEQAIEPESSRWRRHMPLAASVALAAVLGAVAGAAATTAFSKATPAPATNSATVVANETRALRESIVRLSSELAAVKAGADASYRNTNAQLNKLGDRFDRTEKALAEPVAKLAKVTESLDRLERRPAAASAASDVTGSTTVVEKQESKPPVADGWRLVEFFGGRALVESRGGGLFEIGPGSTLPGLGKVESIKREDGKVVVVTPKGVITAAIDQRRSPQYMQRY